MNAPELSRRDLEVQVQRLIDAGRRRLCMAFHGSGRDDLLDIAGTSVRVIAVCSELDLRRRLLDVPGDEYAAFLIPWRAASVPIDLQARFARDGRIQTVGREDRLKGRFGVTEVDDVARDCPLAEYLLAYHPSEEFAIPGGRLTLDALWITWLARVWRLDAGGELALDALLGWAAIDARGPQFVATLRERGADAVRTALLDHLDKKLGPVGRCVWAAWEAGRGAAVLELGLVLAALAGSDDSGVKVWIEMTTRQVFDADIDATALRRIGEASDAALRFLARVDAAAVRAIVQAADRRASIPALAIHVAGSSRLPSAWRARLDQLGRALAEVAASPTAATVQAAVACRASLWRHVMAHDPENGSVLGRVEMALRLASWLAVRPDRELPPTVTPYDDVENLATWYAREGGYLDRARRVVRGGGTGPFADGLAAIVAAVDRVRTDLDRRFARALPAWHAANRRATQVVPIDQAIKRIASAFLDEDPGRRLLVILMDGMAWAQAVELLESMGNRAAVWGPLAWHAMAKHRVGDGPYPAVLTNFPTVTEISRSGFFGGKPIAQGSQTPNSSNDPDKWKANRDVLKHVSGNVVPGLRLRGEVQSRDGSAAPDVLELVMDSQQRIVGVVLNAIDMSLKADRTHETEWKLDTVKALRDLLDKAAEAKRAVLLCSDHGHVPADRFEPGLPSHEGTRWRVWQKPTDPVADYEIGLPASEGVWAPRGAHGIVMIADDAHRYGGGTGSGEHGGASLAEVVAPCVLIGCADVPAATDDPGQAVRPAIAPTWWFFDVGEAEKADVVDDRSKKPRRAGKPAVANQIVMPGFSPPPVAPVVAVATTPGESALARSALFQARAGETKTRELALRAVEFLRARKGVASAAAFAGELGEFVARVRGVVAKLQEILNVDGYQILRFDVQGQQVHLDLEKLEQQFEL